MLFSEVRAERFDLCSWLSDPLLAEWLVEHLKPYGRSICEVGAGTGNMALSLTRAFSPVYMVEPSPAMASRMEVTLASVACEAAIVHSSAEDIALESKVVDIALSKSSFHHFANQLRGLSEMARIARNAIAVVEVVSPDDSCLEYARRLVMEKEPGRPAATIFSEHALRELIHPLCPEQRILHFDQYIDVGLWLEASDLPINRKTELYEYALAQTGIIRDKMQIHFKSGRLVQLRRMALAIGVI